MRAKLVKESVIFGGAGKDTKSGKYYGTQPLHVYEDDEDEKEITPKEKEDIWKNIKHGGKEKPKNTLAYDPRVDENEEYSYSDYLKDHEPNFFSWKKDLIYSLTKYYSPEEANNIFDNNYDVFEEMFNDGEDADDAAEQYEKKNSNIEY